MKTTLLSTMFALATAGLLGQTTIFVKPDATGDGTSWANATDLETAVTRATSGTLVWVQEGTYYPKTMLTVADGVALYGGFDGTELSLLQRDLTDKTTVIDAQKKYGSVIRLGMSATLNGFTIQNGDAQNNPNRNGGGVWADDNTTIENCVIIDNTAMINGGGLYSKGPSLVIGTTIKNNTTRGSGDDVYGCVTIISEITFSEGSEVIVLYDTVTLRDTVYSEVGIPDTVRINDTIIIRDTISDPSETLRATSSIAIVTHPSATAQTKGIGEAFTALSVSATSSEPLTYQWYYCTNNSNVGGTLIAGATGTSYTRPTYTRTISSENVSSYTASRYYYCVVSNSVGSVVSNVSGLHSYTSYCNTTSSVSLGTISFRNSNTYTVGGKTWSSEVMATGCNKTSFNHGATNNYNADCRANSSRTTYGDLFSWCAVIRYQSQLCPNDWRVPTREDYKQLNLALGGQDVAIATSYTNTTIRNKYVATSGTAGEFWGATYGGYCNSGTGSSYLYAQGTNVQHWQLEDATTVRASLFDMSSAGVINPQGDGAKDYGRPLRCIRD